MSEDKTELVETESRESLIKRIAAASFISLLFGILIVQSLEHGFNRGVVIWLTGILCLGVLLGNEEDLKISKTIKVSLLPAFILACTPAATAYIAQFWYKTIESPMVVVDESAFNPWEPVVINMVFVLILVCFLSTLFFLTFSSLGSKVLQKYLKAVYKFGPKGLKKVRTIITGLAAVIAAIFAFVSF